MVVVVVVVMVSAVVDVCVCVFLWLLCVHCHIPNVKVLLVVTSFLWYSAIDQCGCQDACNI